MANKFSNIAMLKQKRRMEFHRTIDELPIKNWFKIQETNDVSWMLKVRREKLDELEKNILTVAFDMVYCEFIDTYGISEALAEVLSIKRDIEVLRADMTLTNDKSLINFIEIKERELKAIIERKNTTSAQDVIGYVEKNMKFALDIKKVSVKQFYSYINLIKKDKTPRE